MSEECARNFDHSNIFRKFFPKSVRTAFFEMKRHHSQSFPFLLVFISCAALSTVVNISFGQGLPTIFQQAGPTREAGLPMAELVGMIEDPLDKLPAPLLNRETASSRLPPQFIDNRFPLEAQPIRLLRPVTGISNPMQRQIMIGPPFAPPNLAPGEPQQTAQSLPSRSGHLSSYGLKALSSYCCNKNTV